MRRSNLALAAASALAVGAAGGIVHPSLADVRRYGRRDDDPDLPTLAKEFRTLAQELKTRDTTVKEWTEKAAAEIKANGAIATETKAALEAQAKAATELAARLGEMEQLVAKLKANDNPEPGRESIGKKFTEDEKVVEFLKGGMGAKGRVQVRVKAITSLTSGDGGAGDLIVPTRVPGIIRQPDRAMTIRDLLSVGRTTSNSIEYVQETGFTNNAAPVAEGAQKPESSLEFTLQSSPVRTIAHWIQASVQVLADVPALQSYIDTRLRFGLEIEEEEQILAGDGTGQNLLGIIPQATPFDTNRRRVGDTRIDIVRRAMTQVRLAEYRPDAIVLHPSDWEEIELTKTTEGAYIWANPRGLLGPTLWGLPVIDTTAVEEGEFLVGNFRMSSQIWDREDATVDVSTEDRDNFIKNMVTIRAEERLALTVYRPEALIYGDFDEVVSS
jgi:HK97 family phage major capsid protein